MTKLIHEINKQLNVIVIDLKNYYLIDYIPFKQKAKMLKHVFGLYCIKNDFIALNEYKLKNQIKKSLYSSYFHELIHWTGHEKRLNRNLNYNNEKIRYIEERIADIGSKLLCEFFYLPKDEKLHYDLLCKKYLNQVQLQQCEVEANKAVNFLLNKLNVKDLIIYD